MTFEERRDYTYNKAVEMLENDHDSFVEACEELDSWNGFLGDDRLYEMEMLDEMLADKTPTEIIDLVEGNNFSTIDECFGFTINGIESFDDKYDSYSANYTVEEVLDALIDNYGKYVRLFDKDLDEIIIMLRDEEFGIDDDGEELETDEEFKERVDAF